MVLRSLAKEIRFGKFAHSTTKTVEKAEGVFSKILSAAIHREVEIPVAIFNSLMAVYAEARDYESCYAMLKFMTHPTKKHRLFPAPTANTFEKMLRALRRDKDRWTKVEQILRVMAFLELKRSFQFQCL